MIPAPRKRWSPPWFGAEAKRALGVGVIVAALATGCGWPYWQAHPVAMAVTLAGCGGFAVVGALLATGRRTRTTGRLFLVASIAWALNWLASWNAGIGPVLSGYAQAGFYLAIGVGVLVYPSGRLEHRADRAWAVLAAVILASGPTALWVTSEPEWAAFSSRAIWPAPFVDRELFRDVLWLYGVLYVVLAVTFVVVLLLRLPRMGRLRRALVLPVSLAMGLVGVSAALTQRPLMEDSIGLDELLRVYTIQGAVGIVVPLALLASGLRVRIAELAVAGRMLRLTAPVSVRRVRDALREVLHDPTLELWFWAPTERVYVDPEGRPVALTGRDGPCPGGARWREEVRTAAGEPLAVVELGGSLRDHASRVEAALVAGGRALETAQLQATVQANLEQVRAAYERLVRAESRERERLVRDLHDGAQQRLLALGAMLATLAAVTGDPEVKERAHRCREELLAALAELRSLVREVRPALLAQDGLGPALEVVTERFGGRVRLDVTARRFALEIESTLFAVLCEALSYAVERARARQVSVRVRVVQRSLVAEVSDDGTRPDGDGADISGRIRALRGHVEIDGSVPGTTTVRVVLPCE
ncbi:sensor histidine kinase [Actinomadura craniellae]|uniref:sensor histidine kinase n=1 Tax=Actinomadura craniellae TaxID=2231787 RepID=UPI001314073D|nr:histidine kinase [Actinomadura craniellae]